MLVFYSFVCLSVCFLFVSHMRADTKRKKHKYENISVGCG